MDDITADEIVSGPRIDRRTAIRLGLGAAGVAAGSSVLGNPLAHAADPPIPASHRFDLHASSPDYFRSASMHEKHHAIQGIAFDDVNQRLFIVQARDGESGDDLCINHVSPTGAVYSSMHLDHAGHGVSIGAEAVGSASYLWVECDADGTDSDARGTAIARFKYVANAAPSGITKYFTGSSVVTVATDPVHQRLAVRRKINGAFHFGVHDLSAGTLSAPLVERLQPPLQLVVDGKPVEQVNQGWTLYGQYIYMLTGTGNVKSNVDPDTYINSTLWCLDLDNGDAATVVSPAKVVEHFTTQAGKSLYFREPEGIAVHRPTGGQVGLYFGFASRPTSGLDRYASLFFKQGWV